MQEKTELEKLEFRNTCRDTHLMQCNLRKCSNPLGHSPYEATDENQKKFYQEIKDKNYFNEPHKVKVEAIISLDMPRNNFTKDFIKKIFEEFSENIEGCTVVESIKVFDIDESEKKCFHDKEFICMKCCPGGRESLNAKT